MIRMEFLMIILALASIWDAFTTVYGTRKVLGDGSLQVAAALLFGALILGFVLNTRRIVKWHGSFFGVLLKFFWFVAICYDFLTSWIAHTDIFVPDENSALQIIIVIGLTLLVSGSPLLLSGLWERKLPQDEQARGYS